MNIPDLTNFNYSLKNEMCVYSKLYDGAQESEISEDFILPDFLPDVKVILFVKARPKYAGKYINGERLEYEGEILYNVLYLAEDNSIKSAVFANGYENVIDILDLNNESIVMVSPTITQTNWRLSNPRKINIKVKLSVDVKVMEKHCVEPRINGKHSIEDELNLERYTDSVTVMNISTAEETDATVSGEIEIESTYPQIKDIIICDAEIYIYESKVMAEKVMYKGDVIVTCVYESENSEYITIIKKLPLSQVVDFYDIDDGNDWDCSGNAFIDTLKVETLPNNYGENRIISIDILYNTLFTAYCNDSVKVTKDVYSTEYDCSVDYSKLDVTSLNRMYSTNFSVNASKLRTEVNAENAAGIICTDINVNIEKVTFDKERMKLIVDGVAGINAVAETAGDEKSYTAIPFEVPVKCELDGGGIDPNFEYTCSALIINSKGRLDSTSIYADFEVAVTMTVLGKSYTDVIETVNLDHEHKITNIGKPPVTLYYPQKGELLWNIAKRYRTTSHAIRIANNLPDKQVIDEKVLIIPQSKCKTKSVYSAII